MELGELSNWPVVVRQAIAWGEMDSYSHVNNVVYFRYFENARLEYFRRLHWPVAAKPSGVGPILHSTQCRFRKPLAWPDDIAVGARVSEVGLDRFAMEHKIFSAQWQGIVADGSSVIVTFDYSAGVKAAVPEELRRRIAEIEGKG